VSAEAFGAEVKQRRVLLRLSRRELARRASLSESSVKNVETGVGGRWRRETVVDLAVALEWEPDEALQITGYDPLTERERDHLGKVDRSRQVLDELWPTLTVKQRLAVLCVVTSMVDPHGDDADPMAR